MDEAIELLRPGALRGELGRRQYDAWVTPLPVRWLLATAHERAGRYEEAASAYEHVLDADMLLDHMILRGITYSFAHQRLVVLNARLGRVDEAAWHWEVFRSAFASPDPQLRPLIDEARDAFEQARRDRSR